RPVAGQARPTSCRGPVWRASIRAHSGAGGTVSGQGQALWSATPRLCATLSVPARPVTGVVHRVRLLPSTSVWSPPLTAPTPTVHVPASLLLTIVRKQLSR